MIDTLQNEIKGFFRATYAAPKEQVHPALTRGQFTLAALWSLVDLVGRVALGAFDLLICSVTCFLSERHRHSLVRNIQVFCGNFCSIPVGILGALFPKPLNTWLGLPDQCYYVH